MNHLAHLFLAGDTVESLIGNIAGDFVKGRLSDDLDPAIREGIMNHRRIDAFTDGHPSIAAFRHVIGYGHYGRVIADVFLDHFLACDFERYANETLEHFVSRIFRTLDPHIDRMPGRLPYVYTHMRDDGWLLSYRHIEGIRTALHFLSKRFTRKVELAPAADMLMTHREELRGHFDTFMNAIRSEL